MNMLMTSVQKLTQFWLFLLLLTSASCTDELAERYQDPGRTDVPSPDKFFTRMLDNNRVRPSYWEMSTFINWHIGIYTQSVGFLNSESMYQQNESYIKDRWNDFYRPGSNGSGVMAHYREIEKAYDGLSPQEQEKYEVFLWAARVILYDQTSQMIDLWGDIPFYEAGMLNLTGDIVYPEFDDAQELYWEILHGLEETSQYFSSAQLTSASQIVFSTQDILLHGDLEKWRRYSNSLRLRLLMRISFADESSARENIMSMLSDPDKYPLTGPVTGAYDPQHDDVLLQPLTDYKDNLQAAFSDWINYPAPNYMLEEILKPANDLRIPVLFDKYGKSDGNSFVPNGDYMGMPLSMTRIDQQKHLGDYAILDSATFLFNTKLPGIVMTSAEVSFLKAEAFERWGGGNAKEEYEKGVKQSIDFYFYLNGLNTYTRNPLMPPSEQQKNDFMEGSSAIQYTGNGEDKLKKIWSQKWVHFGFQQAVQGWAELRRTKTPQLFFPDASLSGYERPPSRLTYPSSERAFNIHYAKVAGKDLRNEKIFWDVR